MKVIEKWKVWGFVISLALIALVINAGIEHRRREQQARANAEAGEQEQVKTEAVAARRAAEEQKAADQRRAEEQRKAEEDKRTATIRAEAEARQAAADAAAEHVRFLARYLNREGVTRTPGIQMIAVVAGSESGRPDKEVQDALTARFRADHVQILPSLFRPEFVSDGLMNDAFSGSSDLLRRLELTNVLDVLVLARQEVEYVTNPSLQNVLTAKMRLQVATFSVLSNLQSQNWTFTALGAGFNQENARSLAEERLIKQIASDTNVSLAH